MFDISTFDIDTFDAAPSNIFARAFEWIIRARRRFRR